jgi:hypothetical protein
MCQFCPGDRTRREIVGTRQVPYITGACTRFTGLAEALHGATLLRQDHSEAPRKKDGMFGLVKRMGQRTAVSLLALFLAGAPFLAAQQAPPPDVKRWCAT